MLKTWKAHLAGAALVAMVGAVGCFDFGEARERCEAEGRWEFMVVGLPLRLPGATGSPWNPIAIF